MSIHRQDRPNAPVRLRKSALLRNRPWMWTCLDVAAPNHHGRRATRADAWADMETHRRLRHAPTATDALEALNGARTGRIADLMRVIVGSKGGTITYIPRRSS